jgi:Tol biopolymer transport system component
MFGSPAWSPDGQYIAARRYGSYPLESYLRASELWLFHKDGGSGIQLTKGTDPRVTRVSGPAFSPDGKYIYFNSDRTGRMQVWRMKADGSDQERVTDDGFNDWFPHPSPDGKWIVFLSYDKDVKGHPANKDVMLRLMPAGGGDIQVLAKLFGGQGTINVPSWSPDSRRVAFVSYQLVHP